MTYLMQNMSYPLEAVIESDGESFHIIYGKHNRGYYLVIPNWNIGCEMSDYQSTSFNCTKQYSSSLTTPTIPCAKYKPQLDCLDINLIVCLISTYLQIL